MTTKFLYPYSVEYIDENGIKNSDTWSQKTLDDEIKRGTVQILRIELAYSVQVALGMVEGD